mgnify:CR=1 FL=1
MAMNSQTFEKAVDWLEALSADYVHDGKLNFPRTEPRQNVLMLDLGVYWVPLTDDNSRGYYHCTNEAAEQLLNMCQEEAAAFDICKSIAAHRLASNGEFLPALKTFTALYMTDMIERPKSTRRTVTWLRSMYFYTMAKVTEAQFGLPLTRNDERSKDRHSKEISACDVVVAAFARHGHHISFRAVKEICVGSDATNKQLRSEFRAWADAQRRAVERDPIARELFHLTWLAGGLFSRDGDENLAPTRLKNGK